MAPVLSLVTVTWNHRDEIQEFLDAVAEARAGAAFEIELVLVDNASADGTAAFVSEGWPWVHVVANDENVGFAEGCTIGLSAAAGEILMLINPDAFASAETLAGMIEFLRAHPKAGAVGCTLLHDDGQPQVSSYPPITALTYWQHSSILYPFFEKLRKAALKVKALAGARECGWLMGSCVMVPRPVFAKIGGLEKSYFMYCEDADWCARIRDAGYQVWFVPELTMRHRQKGSSRRAAEFTFRRVYRSIVHYANRNLKGWARRRLLAAILADMVLRIPVYTVLAFVKPARWQRLGSVVRLMKIVWAANPDLFDDPRPGTKS